VERRLAEPTGAGRVQAGVTAGDLLLVKLQVWAEVTTGDLVDRMGGTAWGPRRFM
jgi:hypothetical protein